MSRVAIARTVFSTRFSLADILVLDGGTILPAPALPASTRISARLKRVQGHGSPVNLGHNASGGPFPAVHVSYNQLVPHKVYGGLIFKIAYLGLGQACEQNRVFKPRPAWPRLAHTSLLSLHTV